MDANERRAEGSMGVHKKQILQTLKLSPIV